MSVRATSKCSAAKCGSKSSRCLEARYEEDPERERRSGDTIEACVQQYSHTLAIGTAAH